LKTKPFSSLHFSFLSRLAASLLVLAGSHVHAQTGVAPSRTGSFFDDLRKRSEVYRDNAQNPNAQQGPTSGVYDYTNGEYIGEESRPLGERPPIGDEVSQALGNQTFKAGYVGSSRRNAADFSGSPSSYPASTSFFAPTYITDPFLAGKRNIRMGPINIGLGMNANVEYNDNITQAHDDPLDDVIAGLYVNVDANWQFTQRNRLTLSASMGVDHYFDHPDKSPRGKEYNFTIYPGSTLSFDFGVGDLHFVVYDRVTIRQDPASEFELDKRNVFGVIQNDIGLAMNWQVNLKTLLSLNYNRSDAVALETSDAKIDRTIDSYSGSLAWTPSGTYTIGIEGSFSVIDYVEDFNNDGTTLNGGVFFSTPITKNTQIKLSYGIQQFRFDAPPTFTRTVTAENVLATQAQLEAFNASLPAQQAAINSNLALTQAEKNQQLAALTAQQAQLTSDLATQTATKLAEDTTEASRSFDQNSNFDDYYYNVTLYNQLNARISQQLSFGHESALSTQSNFVTSDYASYGMGIVAWRGARISLSGYYEDAQDSGGRLAETVLQYGFDSLLSHRITDHLSVALGYHNGNTDSEAVGRDFVQNSYSIDLSYAVNAKLNVGVGYRHLWTTAEVEQQSYVQNRFTISMNYNF
jgi:hypothetical protein